jgi:CHAT domain-containing protein/ribosomal protein L17
MAKGLGVAASIMLAGIVLSLVGCQDERPVVSIEEAKKITASFRDTSFTPPPRKIADVMALLEKEKRADPKAAQALREAARREPPPGLSGSDLARFYWTRGLAAYQTGAVKKAIADLKRANRQSGSLDQGAESKIVWDLAKAESFGGNYADSLRHRKESIRTEPKKGALIAKRSLMARIYAEMGDLEASDSMLAQAEEALEETVGGNSWARLGNKRTMHVLRAKGRILYAKGQLDEADRVMREAIKLAELNHRESPGKFSGLHQDYAYRDLARNLIGQGRLVEAELGARKAVTYALRREGRYSSHTSSLLESLAATLSAQGRYAEAEKLARAIIDIHGKIGTSPEARSLASARQRLAESLVNQERWNEALIEYDKIGKALSSDLTTFNSFFSGDPNWALALIGVGRAGEARGMAERAVARHHKTLGDKHAKTALARAILASALVRLGARKEALSAFRKAVPILLSRSRGSNDESTSKGTQELRLTIILESYIALLADIHGTDIERNAGLDAAAEAFRIANVARGRSVQNALIATAARSAAHDPQLADMVRRMQDAEKQISALYGLLANVMSVPSDQRDPKVVKPLRKRIDRLRIARASLSQEIEKRFPDYAALIRPKPATVKLAQASIRVGEALITVYVGANRTFVWAVPKSGQMRFAAVALSKRKISWMVDRLRKALNPSASTLGDIPAFDVDISHDLYNKLLKPVAPSWQDAKSLLFVAHGALGKLPLSVLVTQPTELTKGSDVLFSNYKKVPWLAREYAVTLVPSVTSLAVLRRLPPPAAGRRSFAGFGDPFFNRKQAAVAPVRTAALVSRGVMSTRGVPLRLRAAPKLEGKNSINISALPRLPDTAEEVRSIARVMKADLVRDIFVGKSASEGRVKSMKLSDYQVIAFATHGLVPGDLDGLTQPALALSAPSVTGGKEDGLLTMGEVLGLRLDADWVVLSACNTGSGKGAGAEAVSGLGRAFFYAGTRALLVSNWPVETTSARQLTTDLFRRQAEDPTQGRAEALRQTMLALIEGPGYIDPDSRVTVFSYAHPIFWAPFTLVGDGGGG